MVHVRFAIGIATTSFLLFAAASTDADPRSAVAVSSVAAIPRAEIEARSRRIDDFIEAGYRTHGVTPNELIDDATFLRRTYLSIVGRIPTYDETMAFLVSDHPAKRRELIDALLDSKGYVSRHFNYWADILRAKTRLLKAPGQPYIDWLKDSLRTNKPYDQLVYELITAEGYTWDNGAAGYYQRDFAMPLDNMSNTARIFLGTSLTCAQCHDHPFNDWTQHDYYQMAAFTYGVSTRQGRKSLDPNIENFQQLLKKEDRWTQRAGNRMVGPLRYAVVETRRQLRLPDDYEYDDAKPGSIVHPKTIYGVDAGPGVGESRRIAYAQWLVSPDNPRFTMVIANRLWKNVMGVGLIEPVDEIESGAEEASHPELLKFLVRSMIELDYDMKQYLRMLYHTRTYQRAVSRQELKRASPYHFAGPPLRRMTAEQIWDSLLALAVENPDKQIAPRNPDKHQQLQELQHEDSQTLLALARNRGEQTKKENEIRQRRKELSQQIKTAKEAKDGSKLKKLRAQVRKLNEERRSAESMGRMMAGSTKTNRKRRGRNLVHMARASELASPAPPGHFLRRFGQSDREVIENASDEASVPQILNMINGPMFSQLTKNDSALARRIAKERSNSARLKIVFLSILSRSPTREELRIATQAVRADAREGYADLTWAMMNTRQFLFIE